MIKGTRTDAIQKRHGIKENAECPWHFLVAKFFQTDVIDKKTGTDIITEAKEIGALFSGNMLLPDQICSDLGTHGKSAQKAHKNCIAAVFGDAEDSTEKRRIEPVQISEQPGLYHQGRDDQEGKQRGQYGSVPQSEAQRTAFRCLHRMGKEKEKETERKKNGKYLFQGHPI